ncbi:SUMF1/EgtB/PvdO family nonheme iron enzyme [Nodularia sp. UHCC 0506]|uniref:SUMF1/EgtB/PvdO family nonheme iron enzyme n=1 Tax=Nodularia sp. UHCC 0506 TaxID=3110243 RepID=UPI002B21D368|nr:SUMF1/EgtB/PvdO family nonheme iron enzyme [Nodularia sp. UHCC 0506]MEA5517076.1 SUMF1/EgtB/PvdO family nonheme iron enzyme [Nodularia sp. UHCC 0506]
MTDLRFRVGLSFAGEYRPFVKEVAQELAMEWGKQKVFYDNFYEAELARLNLDTYLQNIYHKQCDLVVIFIGKDYEKKEWCRLEWRAIRDLIKTKIQKSPSAIMPIRIDGGDVSGLFSIDGYIDIKDRKPKEIASLINQRLSSLGYYHSSFTTPPPPPNISDSQPAVQKFEFKFAKLTITEKKNSSGISYEIQRNDYPREAQGFTEDLGHDVKLEMVKIPGDTFMMGASEKEEGSSDDERPEHQVTVPSFYMGRYLVTQAQWARVAASFPQIKRKLDTRLSHFQGDGNLPVERISWYDADEFCKRLSQKTGRDYRLPSESEWEYACRAGTVTHFHFGDIITTEVANYDGNYTYGNSPKGQYRQKTRPVGSFPPNAFGLYDMHGNLWEWCLDTWHSNYKDAPDNGAAWIDNDNQSRRLLRGGSWLNNPGGCRSAYRYYVNPDYAYSFIGFRVVCSGAAARTL